MKKADESFSHFLLSRESTAMKNLLSLFKTTFAEWNRRDATRKGALLAFYSLLSTAPLVVVVVGICAWILGAQQAQAEFLDQIRQMAGDEAAGALQIVLKDAQHPTAGVLANLVGLGTLLLGASGVLMELRTALNELWRIQQPLSCSQLMGMLKDRFFSFGMVLGVGFLLLISLIASAGLAAAGKFFSNFGWLPPIVWETINFVVSVAVVTGMFSLILRFVPDVRLPWTSIWRGAAVTAILFTLGKTLIGFYLGKAGVGSAYGAASSLVVFIVWVYYSAQIFYFGAIFTHIDARGVPKESLIEVSATAPFRK